MKTNFTFIYGSRLTSRHRTHNRFALCFQTIAMFVLFSLAASTTAILLSLHLHMLPDGGIVVHAHAAPESESEGSHSHTDHDYKYIAALMHVMDRGIETQAEAFAAVLDSSQRAASFQITVHIETGFSVQIARSPPNSTS